MDILFVFGVMKKRLQDIINGNYFVLGNTKNNAYHSNLKLKKKRRLLTSVVDCGNHHGQDSVKLLNYLINIVIKRI